MIISVLLTLLLGVAVAVTVHVLNEDAIGQWSVVAASLQVVATLVLVGVTGEYVGMVEKQAKAAQRSADMTERHVRILSQEQRVRRLGVLQDLKAEAESHRQTAAGRTSDTGRPSDRVYDDEELTELEQNLPLADPDTARATAEALKAARKVQRTAAQLSDSHSGPKEKQARNRFEEANAEAVKAFETVKRKANEEIEFIRFEATMQD